MMVCGEHLALDSGLSEHAETMPKGTVASINNFMDVGAADKAAIQLVESSRISCSCRIRSDTTFGASNQPDYAWCKRPGCYEDLDFQRWVQPGGLAMAWELNISE